MRKIISTVKNPIPFKVSDMLRAKCMFSRVDKINACCQSIKKVIEEDKTGFLKLIEIDNRLLTGTSDLVMKILFGNIIA